MIRQIHLSHTMLLFLLVGINGSGELGHYLIGVVSREMAQDIGYGDKSCLVGVHHPSLETQRCKDYDNETR